MRYPFKSKKPTLSLCMITKNEEVYLHDCLCSVEDVVDEIIIVDTGSTDRTLEIAASFDAQIFRFDWHDDFSAARNESIKHAAGDWIFQIDADERLLPESRQELFRWLKNKTAVCVNVLIDSPKAERKKGHISRAHRLFRNLPGIQYSGRIHEQISPTVAKLGGEEGFSNIKLLHLGYAKSEPEMQEKGRRNYDLLIKQIADQPNNAYYHFTLAQNLMLNKKYGEAREYLKTALEIGNLPNDIICTIYNNLAEVYLKLGKESEGIQFAEKSLTVNKEQTTSYLLLFEIYLQLENVEKQIDCLEAVVGLIENRSQNYQDVSLEAYVDPGAIYLNLANRYFQQTEFSKAQEAYQMAIQIDGTNFSALKGMAECHLQNGESEKAKKILKQILSFTPDEQPVLDKLALLEIKTKQFDQAIEVYLKLLNTQPQNSKIKRRLAALYSKVGDFEKSKVYLQEIQSFSP